MPLKYGSFAGIDRAKFEKHGYEEQPKEKTKLPCHVCGRVVDPVYATRCQQSHCRKCVAQRECPLLEKD